LPAKEKMKEAGYKDIQVEDIPKIALANGGSVKVIAGTYHHENIDVPKTIWSLSPLTGLANLIEVIAPSAILAVVTEPSEGTCATEPIERWSTWILLEPAVGAELKVSVVPDNVYDDGA
jgi:redox-sensitive bicupin YhaK (pirin superfamily)